MPRLVLASVCFLVVVSIAAGDGLLFQMPNDGEYVRFTIQFRIKRDGMEIPGTGLFTMSSVGRETVKGSPCRWIEVKSVEKVKAQETTAIVKMLIPEKVLVSDKDPLDHVVRGWMKRSIREDGEETDLGISEANNPKSGFAGPIQIYLSGPLEDVKTLEAETIETKLGKLECKVRTGKKDIAFGSREISIQFTNWLHHRPPFGLAKARLFVKERTGTMEVVYELLESGKDAKSEIPDKN